MPRILPCLFLSYALGSSSFGSVCVDSPQNTLCLSWVIDKVNITFSASCLPPPGMKKNYWCGFGFSNANVNDMFPAEVVVIQSTAASVYVEDRDSFVGYRNPPCYSTQLSQFINGSASNGAIYASWTRPLTLPPYLLSMHYQNISTLIPMTVIAASSSDTQEAPSKCVELALHTLCQPGVKVQF